MKDYSLNNGNNSKKHYFNKYEFLKIVDLARIDPYEALNAYNDYFSKFPDDIAAIPYYISTLISIEKFNEAEEELHKLECRVKELPVYIFDQEKSKLIHHNILLNKLKLYIYQNRKEEAVNLYYQYEKEFSCLGKEVLFYLNKMAGNSPKIIRSLSSYMIKQIDEYEEADFKEHITKHLADYNGNNKNISVTFFNPEFPIEKVLVEVMKYLPSDKRICLGYIEDTYAFKYDDCGRCKNKIVDYFKIITFTNSNKIITICPTDDASRLPFIDLNYLKEKEECTIKVKQLSQIDKFKKRYNLK